MTKNKKHILWIIGGALLLLAALATVLIVEGCQGKTSFFSRFPEDAVEASLKLAEKGYRVEVDDQPSTLSTLQQDAAAMYDLTFLGAINAYIEAYDKEKGSMQAQIFYFENETDAKTLYEAMKANWQYKEDQGQIRHRKQVVYMGYGETLDALEN